MVVYFFQVLNFMTAHQNFRVHRVLASITGVTALYVSGGAEHQVPAGGGPVCILFGS